MAQEARVAITPVYIKGALDLMSKGQLLPSRPGVVTVEYLKPIEFRGQDHEALKGEVERSLKEAEARWAGKKQRAGGYGLGWCLIPILLLVWAMVVLWRRFW
jgi:1-acyl-sn-glycerol-3-phosphate acyltransferase